MAYRPTNDTKENVIHRNTIFDSQGMVSCCTCGYCIKKTEDATLELTNFKAAPPIVNEQSIGSGVLEFSDYMIPTGSFGGYVLSSNNDYLDYGTNSNYNNRSEFSDRLVYYPFLNCKGNLSVPLYNYGWPTIIDENDFVEKTVKTYQVEIEPYRTPIPIWNSEFENEYYKRMNSPLSVFGGNHYLYEVYYAESLDPITYRYTGSLLNYFNFIKNNDYSLSGFRKNATCENNIIQVMQPSYFLDVSSYQFSYQYPNYTFFSSIETIYPGPTQGENAIASDLPKLWAYQPYINKMSVPYKNGYVLKSFEINKNGVFLGELSLIAIYPVIRSKATYIYQVPSWGGPPVYYKTEFSTLDQHDSVGSTSIVNRPSTFNDNQNIIENFANGSFRDLYVNDGYYVNKINKVEVVSFGYKKVPTENPLLPFTYSIDQPYVPLKYTASKTDRTQITSTTDATGRTTLTIRNILWSGKILLENTYKNNQGSNIGRLANGTAIPSSYKAVLKGGFESDAIISFQSVPLCKPTSIPDRLRKVSKLKVNFENYKKIPQFNMFNYNALLDDYSKTPGIIDVKNPSTNPPSISFPNVFNFTSYIGYDVFTWGSYTGVNTGMYPTYSPLIAIELNNYEFYPPNINQSNEFIVVNKFPSTSNNYEFSIIPKDIVAIDPPVLTSYVAKPGRAYPDFGVADRFKSCLLINGDKDVWKTGNEVQFVGLDYLVTNGGSGYTSVPTVTLSNGGGTGASAYATISNGRVVSVTTYNKGKDFTSNKTVVISGGGGNGATAVDISFTPFYSIYMEEIKDEKQTAGQTLIRIARTLQDANNGIYIPNVGLETLYKDRSLSVKFLYGWKDVSKENLPRYENVNLNDPVPTNVNADILGASYSKSKEWVNNFNGIFDFKFSNYSGLNIFFRATNGAAIYNYDNIYFDYYFSYYSFRFSVKPDFEVISLSPLKIKYKNVRFDAEGGGNNRTTSFGAYNPAYKVFNEVPVLNISVQFPFFTDITNLTAISVPGFQCDIVMEEVVDEFIQEALPASFNQILQNVEFIQTSNMMNPRTPMQMIDPEQCEHIGKVIDRKDCNCPKKWVRLCDVHGKTDWKNCMRCKDFKVSE